MAKSKWVDLEVGDFFALKNQDTFYNTEPYSLYQKICDRAKPFNAVLINTGDLCCIYESSAQYFERVEVAFEIKPIGPLE